MTTSPAISHCAGCAPASHHWILPLIWSSLAKARLTPSAVPSTSYNCSGLTPSASKAISRVYLAPLRKPRLPGKSATFQKSAQELGALASLPLSYAMTIDHT
ncbi:hypothetical protein D9M71_517010 [compost metagenome]